MNVCTKQHMIRHFMTPSKSGMKWSNLPEQLLKQL